MVFLNRQVSEEYYECPNADCQSRMVIERLTNEIETSGDQEKESVDECDGPSIDNNDSSFSILESSAVDLNCNDCKNNSTYPSVDCEQNEQNDSSFAIVIPSKSVRDETSVSSWPPCCQRNLLITSKSFTSGSCMRNEKCEINEKHKFNKEVTPDIFDVYKKQAMDPSLGSYSNSPGSCTSSVSKSCGHSRQTSKGSIKVVTKTPRSAMHTPISTQDSLFDNMKEFGKCNHRLKLYFDINVFAKLDEEFLCQIRV